MRPSTSSLLMAIAIVSPGAAFGGDAEIEVASLTHPAMPRSGNNDAPRLIRNESTADSARSQPGYRGETNELSYRWWKSNGRADLGLGLGTLTYGSHPTGSFPGLGSSAASNVLAAGTVVTLGVRYRTSPTTAVYADASGVHGRGFEAGESVVGKVGIEFKAAQSRLHIDYGGLGLRLAGDTRMTVRVKRGGLGIFMRSKF